MQLTAVDGVTLNGANGDVTTTSTYTVNADSNTDGTGTYSQNNAGSAVSSGTVDITAADVVDMSTGELLYEANQELSADKLHKIVQSGVTTLEVFFPERRAKNSAGMKQTAIVATTMAQSIGWSCMSRQDLRRVIGS